MQVGAPASCRLGGGAHSPARVDLQAPGRALCYRAVKALDRFETATGGAVSVWVM